MFSFWGKRNHYREFDRHPLDWKRRNPNRLRDSLSGDDMSGREVKEYTNLSDPKGPTFLNRTLLLCRFHCKGFLDWALVYFLIADKKQGKGKIDDEDVTFQRMVAKVSASPSLSFLCLCTNCIAWALSLCCIKSFE